MWDYVAPCPVSSGAGVSFCADLRNDLSANPSIVLFASASTLYFYNKIQKSWKLVTTSLAMAGTFGAGSGCTFAPSRSLFGTIGAGSTNQQITTSTTLSSAASLNQFANKGDGLGFKIRISSVSSGKTEEVYIDGNTATTTPTIHLATPLSFVPSSGDTYEILAGRFFFLNAGTLASGSWKSFESATNKIATLGYTNLPATVSTDCAALALDELYVPYNRQPGEGFLVGSATYNNGNFGCLQATASAASTITGQATGGDASVLANEYRNFQIRIVEDTTTPTSVGQRRIIASHTAGASPVYTMGAAWSVTPSSSAKFVIELPNQIIIRSSATTSVYVYNYSGQSMTNGTNTIASDAWSVTYYAAGTAGGAGNMLFGSYGIIPDAAKNARQSFIYYFRGGNSTALDVLDIAGGTTGAWSSNVAYDGNSISFNTGSCGKYAPGDTICAGKYAYINYFVASATNQMLRFDVKNRTLTSLTSTDWIQTGTATAGDRLIAYFTEDELDTYATLLLLANASPVTMEMIIQAP